MVATLRPPFCSYNGCMAPPIPAVSTTALTRRYDSRVAVDRLTLTVEEGRMFGLLDPNGAGR